MTTYNYDDGFHTGGRRPRLYLARGSEVRKFEGENIPGFCAVCAAQFSKNGKWSNTNYTLALAPGVRAIELVSPLHGVWGDDLPSWGAAAERLGLPIEVTQAIVREEYPTTAQRWDALEEFAFAVEANGATTEVVVISFGSPSRRDIRDGFWEKPKRGRTSDGREVIVRPTIVDGRADWSDPIIETPAGAKVVTCRQRPGMHGGYWTVEVAVPLSAE